MDYEEQLSSAKFRAERDMARQEVKELREELDAIKAEREYDVKALNHRIAEIEPRLMPEGMEWPRYENGEPVQFGDETNLTDAVESITFNADGTTLIGDKHGDFDAKYVQCVKRPQVLASDDDGCCDPGTYRCQEAAFTCDSCGHTVFVDKCMIEEIRYLRSKGIRTLNCCCGHDGKAEPSIIVNEGDECRMLNMGYERHVNEYGATYFTPKSSCPTKVLAADGEPLEVGQTVWFVEDGDSCDVAEISRDGRVLIEYFDGSGSWHDASEFTHQRPVLDADGNRIEPAMDVWWICEGDERGIHAEKLHVESIGDDGFVTCDPFNGGTWVELEPSELYVNKPVLDADGVPIHEGDTVYGAVFGGPFTVTEVSDKGSVFVDAFPDTGMHGSMFTHAKPEPPDTWERLKADIYREIEMQPTLRTTKCGIELFVSNVVRRCKSLAERGE